MSAQISVTPRGFVVWTILNRDYSNLAEYHIEVQESSLATERKVWVGINELEEASRPDYLRGGRMHLTEQAARDLRDALTQWLEGA